MNYTQLLLDRVNNYRAEIVKTNKFFTALRKGELDDMGWVWQLWHQSDGYTRALSLRSALCEDLKFKEVFAQHACEEVRHPFQLLDWMKKEGFDISLLPNMPPTPETKFCISLSTKSAQSQNPLYQVFILNVLSEGIGLTFYTEVIERLRGRLYGPYWHIHKEVDDIHMGLGVDLIDNIKESDYHQLCGVLDDVYMAYFKMIESFDTRKAS